MAFKGPILDQHRGDTIPEAYITCTGASRTNYRKGEIAPLFSAFVSEAHYRADGVALAGYADVPPEIIFGDTDAVGVGKPISFNKKSVSLDQIYTEVKKLPKAKDFTDVLEAGQATK